MGRRGHYWVLLSLTHFFYFHHRSQFSLHSHLPQIRKPNKLTSPPISAAYASSNYESDKSKLAQVSKKLESTSMHFKRSLHQLHFILLLVVLRLLSSPCFWSFGYIRLSDRLRKTANDPSKAPPRADVLKGLKNGIVVNLLGMGAAILGRQATVGTLVAKALTTSANPLYRSGSSPILALDVFLVQYIPESRN
ncbi:hypothetical protein L6452_28137 [Arctium lappa]|uniref:Uncharacterized protein n=1 Tax=Arctium lappa TaxID=4217 RepID=A0ACB8ZYG6_ARCLA|nr:hypothetical protein L6452_28137 [Arctium lappa]